MMKKEIIYTILFVFLLIQEGATQNQTLFDCQVSRPKTSYVNRPVNNNLPEGVLATNKYVSVDFYITNSVYVAMGSTTTSVYNKCVTACTNLTTAYHNTANNGNNINTFLTFCVGRLVIGTASNNSQIPFTIVGGDSGMNLDNLTTYVTDNTPVGDLHVLVGTTAELGTAGRANWIGGTNLLSTSDACCLVKNSGNAISDFTFAHETMHLIGANHASNPSDVAHAPASPSTLMSASPTLQNWHSETLSSYQSADFTGVSSTSCMNVALSVELLKFTGTWKGETAILNWQTASEKNNSHFDIERSTDGEKFETIGTVAGHGTTNQTFSYQFTDKYPHSINYYRLRQMDFDGKATFSNIVNLSKENDDDILVFPNPTKGKIYILTTKPTTTSIRVFNNLGQLVLNKKSMDNSDIDLSGLANGVYQIEVFTEGIVLQKRVIKE